VVRRGICRQVNSVEVSISFAALNIVANLLKTRTVEPEKQPLLGNARTQQ
jgi:hypothetical protein